MAVVIPFFRIGFCASSLIFMLSYIWSKNFATQNVSLYGLLTIQVLPLLRVKYPHRLDQWWCQRLVVVKSGHRNPMMDLKECKGTPFGMPSYYVNLCMYFNIASC